MKFILIFLLLAAPASAQGFNPLEVFGLGGNNNQSQYGSGNQFGYPSSRPGSLSQYDRPFYVDGLVGLPVHNEAGTPIGTVWHVMAQRGRISHLVVDLSAKKISLPYERFMLSPARDHLTVSLTRTEVDNLADLSADTQFDLRGTATGVAGTGDQYTPQ